MKLAPLLILALQLSGAQAANTDVVSGQWVQKWRADLDYLERELPRTHARLFHTLPENEFNNAIEVLRGLIPDLSHHQIITELAAIAASIGDGHTRLTLPMVEGSGFFNGHSVTPPPNDPSMLFGHYPVRLHLYSDGLYVRKIGAENAAYAGAKVVRIGRLPARQAMDAAARVIHRDNGQQLKHLLPTRLVLPELLWALGISGSAGQTEFVLETDDGEQHSVVLKPVGPGQSVEWVSAADRAAEIPLYLRDSESNFWFEHLVDQQTVYWQYNEVYGMGDESIANFAGRLARFIAEHGVRNLIVDLRFNSGGDNSLNRSLLHALIRLPALREPGSLFVITGRGTFSAAMMFAIDLEKHTNAIFVGEPTGAAPNHYGDSRKLRLPNSGLTIRVSTLYWQYSGPKDKRQALEPHIPAELSSVDFREGRDPALAAILSLLNGPWPDAKPVGHWASRVLGHNTVVHVSEAPEGWAANIDFPDLDATGLPLTGTSFQSRFLRFDFPNGDQVISFKGAIKGDVIVGKAVIQGQSYPWVALRR